MKRDRRGRFLRVHRPERYRGWYRCVMVGRGGMKTLAEAFRFLRPGGTVIVAPGHHEAYEKTMWVGLLAPGQGQP